MSSEVIKMIVDHIDQQQPEGELKYGTDIYTKNGKFNDRIGDVVLNSHYIPNDYRYLGRIDQLTRNPKEQYKAVLAEVENRLKLTPNTEPLNEFFDVRTGALSYMLEQYIRTLTTVQVLSLCKQIHMELDLTVSPLDAMVNALKYCVPRFHPER